MVENMLRLGRPLRAWLKDSPACVHALFQPRSKGDGMLDAAELDPWKPPNAFVAPDIFLEFSGSAKGLSCWHATAPLLAGSPLHRPGSRLSFKACCTWKVPARLKPASGCIC